MRRLCLGTVFMVLSGWLEHDDCWLIIIIILCIFGSPGRSREKAETEPKSSLCGSPHHSMLPAGRLIISCYVVCVQLTQNGENEAESTQGVTAPTGSAQSPIFPLFPDVFTSAKHLPPAAEIPEELLATSILGAQLGWH